MVVTNCHPSPMFARQFPLLPSAVPRRMTRAVCSTIKTQSSSSGTFIQTRTTQKFLECLQPPSSKHGRRTMCTIGQPISKIRILSLMEISDRIRMLLRPFLSSAQSHGFHICLVSITPKRRSTLWDKTAPAIPHRSESISQRATAEGESSKRSQRWDSSCRSNRFRRSRLPSGIVPPGRWDVLELSLIHI